MADTRDEHAISVESIEMEIAKLREKIAAAEARNRRGMCTYCGHIETLPPGEDHKTGLVRIMAKHIESCEQHPLKRIAEIVDPIAAERDQARTELGNLLAVIHRDGGHYQSEHGTEKASKDAQEIVVKWLRDSEELAECKRDKKRLDHINRAWPNLNMKHLGQWDDVREAIDAAMGEKP